MGRSPQAGGVLWGACAALSLACSVESEPYLADADSGSIHALVRVERAVTLETSGATHAGAIAAFVRVPATVEPRSAFELVGLSRAWPSPGSCTPLPPAEDDEPLVSMQRLELLEAGDVRLTAEHSESQLAPRAFPTVTDAVSGVVYTTRDRAADPLPPGSTYRVSTSGKNGLGPLSIPGTAPEALEGVTVGGMPLSELDSLPGREPLDFIWGVGASGDLVAIEVSSPDAQSGTLCTFRDEIGAGTIPAAGFSGPARVAVHRMREVWFAGTGLNRGTLRFDFQVTANTTLE